MKTWKLNLNSFLLKFLLLTSVISCDFCFANEFTTRMTNIRSGLLEVGGASAGIGIIIGIIFLLFGIVQIGSWLIKCSAGGVVLLALFNPLLKFLSNLGG